LSPFVRVVDAGKHGFGKICDTVKIDDAAFAVRERGSTFLREKIRGSIIPGLPAARCVYGGGGGALRHKTNCPEWLYWSTFDYLPVRYYDAGFRVLAPGFPAAGTCKG
jgi:hypothetical protein